MPYNGWTPDGNQTGIENVSGGVGLNYLSGPSPAQNMYHDSLAILFSPPESTSYEVHDAGIRNAMNDRNGGFFVLNNEHVSLWAVARNYGNQPESDFFSFVKVKRQSGSVVFYDSVETSISNPGDLDSIVFATDWVPIVNGSYTVEIYTVMPGDVFPPNDTAVVECHVVTMPATLTYDKGMPDAFYHWNGPGGYGNRFVPPVYPCSITSIRMYAQAGIPNVHCAFGVYDDNGPGGVPGDTLFDDNTLVDTIPQWYVVNLPTPVVIDEGAFFVGAMSSVANEPSFGMDTLAPFSGQSWEYTGVWAPSRDLWVRDAVINAMVSATGISEWVGPAPVNPPARIEVKPNPFGASARLRLVNARGSESTIEVYDAAGALVRTLEPVRGTALFDGRGKTGRFLADGVYFARIAGNDTPVTKLIISR